MKRPAPMATTLLVAAALAGPAVADDAYRRCLEEADGTNTAWGACGGEAVRRAEAALDEAWARLMASVEGRTEADLRAEQDAWTAYRDLSCLFYANGDFGREGQVLHAPACRVGVVEARTREIETYLAFGPG